jgi:schlafen family protein
MQKAMPNNRSALPGGDSERDYMAVKDQEELLTALSSGDFEILKGTREMQQIDFKDQPYMLNSPESIWEWCKDVAAFANGGGGSIVVGVRTEPAVDTREDIAVEHTLIPKRLVNFDQHYKLLREYLIPELRGLRMEWFPPGGDSGLLLIDIPHQLDRDLPVVVRRVVEPGQKGASAFAVPTRVGADTTWYGGERMHRMLSDDRLRGATSDSREWETIRRSRMDARIEEMAREYEWTATPCLFLQGAPPKASGLLSEMHEPAGIRGALERPNVIRANGFVPYAGPVETKDSGLASFGGGKAIWIDKDGFITAGGVVTDEWFARDPFWPRSKSRFQLNPLVLTEYALEFFRFVYRELAPRAPSGAWYFRVIGRGLKTRGETYLSPGDHRDPFRTQRAVAASGDHILEAFTGSGIPAKDALTAVHSVYAHYGLPRSAIPFTLGEEISEQALRTLPMMG